MLQLLKDSWTGIQDELRTLAGDAAYDSWLSGLRPVLMERGVVYIEAASGLVRDRVKALFRPLLQEVLGREIGVPVQVELQEVPGPSMLERLEVSPQRPIVDEGNRTAWLVLQNLAAGEILPGSLFFLHGQPGVGKSFLMRAGRPRTGGARRFMELDLLQLLRAFQHRHQHGDVDKLRLELVEADTLFLDEVHRVSGKPGLQAFLLTVLRQREQAGRLTVLASRWHPKEIRLLDPVLTSVLMSGFVTKVDPPGPLARLRYLRALEGAPSRNGRATAIEGMAQQPVGSYTELKEVWARSREGGLPRKYLELVDPGRVFTRVCHRVCERLGVDRAQLCGKGQGRQVSLARKVLAFLCVQDGLSRAEVGRFLDGRTRAAVSYMYKSLEKDMADKPDVRALVEGLL